MNALRKPMTWRIRIVALTLFCLLCLLGAEAFHQHGTAEEAQHCALCLAVDHQPFGAVAPAAGGIAAVLFLLFFLLRAPRRVWHSRRPCAAYSSRAPPFFLN